MRNKLLIALPTALVLVAAPIFFPGCGKTEEDVADSDAAGTSPGGGGSSGQILPQVNSINLRGVGSPGGALSLTTASDCDKGNLGVFGFALGTACSTADFASKFLLGEKEGDYNGDGKFDCSDMAAAKADNLEPGIMMHLLCGELFDYFPKVTSLSFAKESGASGPGVIAVSFADFAGAGAVGDWSTGGQDSYPANIRIFGGDAITSLTGWAGLELTDFNNGTISVASMGEENPANPFKIKVGFSNKPDVSSCATAPSADTCHWQEVSIYGGEGAITAGPPNGLRLKVYADDKRAPTFIVMEGKIRYTQETAALAFPVSAVGFDITAVRTIYFQAVQKGTQIWGRFKFTDSNGALLNLQTGFGNLFAFLNQTAGFCQNLNESNTDPDACSEITYTDFDGIWVGEEDFQSITESPVDVNWEGAPTEMGVCQASGCTTF